MARLKHAPVFFTLAQMRFNNFLDLAPVLPPLQEALRKSGYPDYEASRVAGIEFRLDADNFSLDQKASVRHVFRNKGRTAAVVLDPAALTFELSEYPVFEDFSSSFFDALALVHQHRPIEYCDRLGMRMLDAVQPIAGESLNDYVCTQALGFPDLLGGGYDHQHSLTESNFKSGTRTLVMRTIRAAGGVLFPMDLQPLRLNIAPRFTGYEGESLILDTDCFQEGRADFSIDTARADLRELKLAITCSFNAVVTSHAVCRWEPIE